jgi:hypothetical protein
MGSYRSGKFPAGYEPFQTSYGTPWFYLSTMTMPFPRLKLCLRGCPKSTLVPLIIRERKPACVMNPGVNTEAFRALRTEAEIFEIRHRIRCLAAESQAKLDLVLSLMAYGGNIPLCSDPADRFEAYLSLRSPELLLDLLALLDMPDYPPRPTDPELPRAA